MADFEGVAVQFGQKALKAYLLNNERHLHEMDTATFTSWLLYHINRWRQRDPAYALQWEMCDLKKAHRDTYLALRATYRAAEQLYQHSSTSPLLHVLREQQRGAETAIEGLQQALERADPEQQPDLQKKLDSFLQRCTFLEEVIPLVTTHSREYKTYHEIQAIFSAFCRDIGLTALEEQLRQHQRSSGHARTRAGKQFEQHVIPLIHRLVTPHALRISDGSPIPEDIHLLSSVTLEAARSELDFVIVRCFQDPKKPVDVLGIIEVKRDINDVVHGFLQRQDGISWFCQDEAGYDPKQWRTKTYQKGHFDRAAVHTTKTRDYVFSKRSFHLFSRDEATGYYMNRLYFITDQRTLQGVKASEHMKLMLRLTRDLDLDLDDPEKVAQLHQKAKDKTSRLQTLDVLRLYLRTKRWARQILMIDRKTLPT